MIWVLIDASYIAHRARCTMRNLEFDHVPTGVLFGFFEALHSICFDHRIASNRVAIFFDSKASYRKNSFPEYKQKRHDSRTPQEIADIAVMHRQMDILQHEVLPSIGFPCYRQIGLESDDLMARAALDISLGELFRAPDGTRKAGVMVTADGDLFQCITWCVHWYDPARDLYLDPLAFLTHKGICHSQWGDVKALSGCKTDNVPGIPGIGEKSAVDYLTNILPRSHKRHERIESAEGREIAKRNRELVMLPHVRTKKFELTVPVYNPTAFRSFVDQYELKSYIDEHAVQWQNFFEGRMSATSAQVARARMRHGA